MMFKTIKFFGVVAVIVISALLITGFMTGTGVAQAAGGSWQDVGTAGFSAGVANYTSLAFDNAGVPYVAYMDAANGDKTTVMKLNAAGTGWEIVGTAGFSAGPVFYTSLAFDNAGVPHVAYADDGNGGRATVMKLNAAGTGWEVVGTAGFSAGFAGFTSLAFDNAGVPHVAYMDFGHQFEATVMKLNAAGTGWQVVGTARFSAGWAIYTSLAFDTAGVPHVAYKDSINGQKATVMKLNAAGTGWQVVGTAAFSAGAASYTSLAFDNAGVPHVAYQDGGNGNKTTVMKLNAAGTGWQVVGTAGFSAGPVEYTSLAFDNAGVPHVAYRDGGNSDKATVMKLNAAGTGWEVVGTAGFSAGAVDYTSLAFHCSGTPYVAYMDSGNGDKVTVMKFDDPAVVSVGDCAVPEVGVASPSANTGVDGGIRKVNGVWFNIPAGAIPSSKDADNNACRIVVDEAGMAADYGFSIDETVWDIKIFCDGAQVHDFEIPITICVRPSDGSNLNKTLFHRHGGQTTFSGLPTAGGKSGWVCGSTGKLSLFLAGEYLLPSTGFAPETVTALAAQPESVSYANTAMTLTIPKLGITQTIMGVPQSPDGWNVSWLGNGVGYLSGTAFPTWAGNTALTGHVWNADGSPGIFHALDQLQHGDQFTIEAWGLTYTYEVRESEQVYATNLSVLEHSDYDIVTLLTCEGYSEWSESYGYRRVVMAVLVEVYAE